MAKRSYETCPEEDELREMLTYLCPLTGKKRCPPLYKENVQRTEIHSFSLFWGVPIKKGLGRHWLISITNLMFFEIESSVVYRDFHYVGIPNQKELWPV